MYMVLFVLNDPDRLGLVLDAWEAAGITDVTVLESTGLHRVKQRFIPMRFWQPIEESETSHLTLMAFVPEAHQVDDCMSAVEAVVGDLSQQATGIFAAWEISQTRSIVKGAPTG